jgi:cysteine synthase A
MDRKRFADACDLIGGTPLIKLRRPSSTDGATVYAKLEFYNPGGSVKDRIALSMVEDAERNGLLEPGCTIVEPTSGNTGIGLAMVGAVKGYSVVIVLPEDMTYERVGILQAYGAEVVFSPPQQAMQGAVEEAERLLAANQNWYMPQQFNNSANPEVHRRTTAREVLRSMGKSPIHALVAGVGTGGTITGMGEVLKGRYPDILVVGVEPASSAVLSGGQPGMHMIQGIGAGFVPKVLNLQILDEILTVTDEDAYLAAKQIALEEGLFVGISSGATYWAAQKVAERLGKGATVVTVFPDGGERYLSFERYFKWPEREVTAEISASGG